MTKKTFNFEYTEYSDIKELTKDEQHLILKAKEATKNSYAPYSKFSVGAAIKLANGEIIQGSNQENAAYPSGLCAERTAMFYANHKYPTTAVDSIAVAVNYKNDFIGPALSPCGACRQVLLESETRFKQDITIFLYGSKQIIKLNSIKNLLPFYFDGELF